MTLSAGRRRCAVAIALGAWSLRAAANVNYDPMALPETPSPSTLELRVHDAKRGRDIPLRAYLPQDKAAAPVVLFSHGLGGSREGNVFLGMHWASRGYVAVFLQHPGSDESVWKDLPQAQRMGALRDAANLRNMTQRFGDVPAVLDQLERWNAEAAHPLAGRMDLQHIGMSGHSFGALTTQAVSGQKAAFGLVSFTDTRIKAAIVMSPIAPRRAVASAFEDVHLPWLVMTGTRDDSAIGGSDAESRVKVYEALPPGRKYLMVLENAEHSAFTDRALPGDTQPRNPNHHRAMLAISTAFWDAWLRGDEAARGWLDSAGPKAVLQPHDRWEHK